MSIASDTLPAPADAIAIRQRVRNFAAFADARLFSNLENLFAAEVLVDYESLNGAPAARIAASELMQQWAGVLPGFDLTYHDLSDIQVRQGTNDAEASASVCASHYIGPLFWEVGGRYDFIFEKQNGDWRISLLRFNLRGERGTREVFAPALAAVAARKGAATAS